MLRVAVVLLGGVIGAAIGLYGGAYGRLICMRLTHPTYDPGMDFTILLFATAGAVLGGAVGAWLGIWLTSHSRAD